MLRSLKYMFVTQRQRTLKTKAEQYIIYADICLLEEELMNKYHIIFKKIPRDITRF